MIQRIKQFTLVVGLSLFVFLAVPTTPTYAANSAATCTTSHFLSFPAWYNNLTNADCSIESPAAAGGLSPFIWTIALNILNIMFQLVAYVSVAFIIWGGFLYLVSAGQADKITSGRKMIFNAIIGLVVSFFAIALVSLVGANLQ